MEVVSHLNKLQLVPLSYWESRQIDVLIDRLFILTTITGYHNLWVRYKSDSLYFALCLMNKSFAECVCVYVPVVMRVCLNAQTVGFPLESFPQHLTTSSSFWGGGSVNFIPIGLQPANGRVAATAKVVGTVGVTDRKQEVREVLRKARRSSLSLVRRRRRCR